jgi:hypothetical protein
MLAERFTVSLTRTIKRLARTAFILAGVALGIHVSWRAHEPLDIGITLVSSALARDVSFKSPQLAFEQGVSAYKTGDYEIAIPAFEYISGRNDTTHKMFAHFYLARIHADNTGTRTDHAKAYMLYQGIADEYADIDPDDVRRAPFVAKALTAVAIYVRDGLPELGLKPDPERAIEYLRHAATFFNEPDAQFEFAKMLVSDERQRATGMHFLTKLAREHHAPAQATFADMLARGRFVRPDRPRALALVRMAVENSGPADALWIADVYQQVYCTATGDDRQRSEGFVADWRRTFQQQRSAVEQPARAGRAAEVAPLRVCSNGERPELPRRQAGAIAAPAQPLPSGVANGLMPAADPSTTAPPRR